MRWFYDARQEGKLIPITIERRRIVPAIGFSPLELERAGFTIEEARSLLLPIDRFRQTSIGTNVLQLYEFRSSDPN